jgi:hypothetical protein
MSNTGWPRTTGVELQLRMWIELKERIRRLFIVRNCKKPHNNGQHIANRPRICGFMDAAALFPINHINFIAMQLRRRYLTQLKSAATISFSPRTDSLTNSMDGSRRVLLGVAT